MKCLSIAHCRSVALITISLSHQQRVENRPPSSLKLFTRHANAFKTLGEAGPRDTISRSICRGALSPLSLLLSLSRSQPSPAPPRDVKSDKVANSRPPKSRGALVRRILVLASITTVAVFLFEREPATSSGSARQHGAAATAAGGGGLVRPSRIGGVSYGGARGGGDDGYHRLQRVMNDDSDSGVGAGGGGGSTATGRPGEGVGDASGDADGDQTYGIKAVGIFHVFKKPPWGGGNQFLMALVKEFRRRKIKVVENAITDKVQLYMANAVTFKVDAFREAMRKAPAGKKLKLVHRLDGPYYAARYNKDPRKEASEPYRAREDNRVYEVNSEFACASIFQSQWSYDMNVMLGYKPTGPTRIVNNAVDETIFNSQGRVPFDRQRKIRIVGSSWSAGERKGFKTFKWLDDNLDFERYSFTFMGNVPDGIAFKNIKHAPPVTSEKLAPVLKEHDVYIAASYLEPCSNALVEALASGLPAVYQLGSGHDELVKSGGLSFAKPEDIPAALNKLVEGYETYQANIRVTSVKEAADAYLQVYAGCLGL